MYDWNDHPPAAGAAAETDLVPVRTGYGPPAIGDWRAAIADAMARVAASEQRTAVLLAALAKRVGELEGEVTSLRARDGEALRALERRVTDLSDRLRPLEERAEARAHRFR